MLGHHQRVVLPPVVGAVRDEQQRVAAEDAVRAPPGSGHAHVVRLGQPLLRRRETGVVEDLGARGRGRRSGRRRSSGCASRDRPRGAPGTAAAPQDQLVRRVEGTGHRQGGEEVVLAVPLDGAHRAGEPGCRPGESTSTLTSPPMRVRPAARARSTTAAHRRRPTPRRRWSGRTWTSAHATPVFSVRGSSSSATPTRVPVARPEPHAA